ncbi:MAG: hypothetical protein ACLSAF_06515 [Intestinimonas sp.]
MFDSADTYAETTQALARALGQTGCPVFIAPGNHDYFTLRSPYSALHWPENVHIFAPPRWRQWSVPTWAAPSTARPSPLPAREDSPSPALPPGGRSDPPGGPPRGGGREGALRPHPQGGYRRLGPCLSGAGSCPRRVRPPVGGRHRLGVSRLSGGPGL